LKFHLKTGNAEQIGKTAHKMLGSFRQLGMEELAGELKGIELNSETEADLEKLKIRVISVEFKIQLVMKLIKEELKTLNN
jgi:hypothetical protein